MLDPNGDHLAVAIQAALYASRIGEADPRLARVRELQEFVASYAASALLVTPDRAPLGQAESHAFAYASYVCGIADCTLQLIELGHVETCAITVDAQWHVGPDGGTRRVRFVRSPNGIEYPQHD